MLTLSRFFCFNVNWHESQQERKSSYKEMPNHKNAVSAESISSGRQTLEVKILTKEIFVHAQMEENLKILSKSKLTCTPNLFLHPYLDNIIVKCMGGVSTAFVKSTFLGSYWGFRGSEEIKRIRTVEWNPTYVSTPIWNGFNKSTASVTFKHFSTWYEPQVLSS